jgi:hypothetical protein
MFPCQVHGKLLWCTYHRHNSLSGAGERDVPTASITAKPKAALVKQGRCFNRSFRYIPIIPHIASGHGPDRRRRCGTRPTPAGSTRRRRCPFQRQPRLNRSRANLREAGSVSIIRQGNSSITHRRARRLPAGPIGGLVCVFGMVSMV